MGLGSFLHQISVFQCFCLFPLDSTVYSAIFQTLTYFQGASWESREKALSVACQFSLTPYFSLMPCLSLHCTELGLLHIQSLCSSADLQNSPPAFCSQKKQTFQTYFSTSLSLSTTTSSGPSQNIVGTNRPFSYQNPLSRHLECNFLHSTKSFTNPLSSMFCFPKFS